MSRQVRSGVRARSARKGARVDRSRPCVALFCAAHFLRRRGQTPITVVGTTSVRCGFVMIFRALPVLLSQIGALTGHYTSDKRRFYRHYFDIDAAAEPVSTRGQPMPPQGWPAKGGSAQSRTAIRRRDFFEAQSKNVQPAAGQQPSFMGGGLPMARCVSCGKPFAEKRSSQRYCGAPGVQRNARLGKVIDIPMV